MAISIVPNSAAVSITTRPGANAPVVGATNVRFQATIIRATGSVDFNGLPADSTAGWFVGWIQAQWIETNWGYFRGQFDNHGSVFHQRGRAPARPAQPCRDTVGAVGTIFYSTSASLRPPVPAGGPFPVTVTAGFNDTPSESYPLSVVNSLTGQPNFLREVQLEFHFATILVVRDPAGVFHQLKHFYWNLRWQHRFTATAFPPTTATMTVRAVTGGNGTATSRIFGGAATDRRFSGVLLSAQTQNCNQVASGASTNPNVREARRWANFDVTK